MRDSIDFSTVLAASVHDMKNSIGMLVHLVDELSAELDQTNPRCGQLQFEAARLNNYLIQLMTLYKLEQQQYRFSQDEVYLDEFIEDLVLMNQPLLAPRGVVIEQQVPSDLSWDFDAALVQGVLGNILTNLIRYANGKVQVTAENVQVSADTAAEGLVIRVEDDGRGFPERMLGRLEGEAMGVDFISGSTGFGLYFAVKVAAAHQREGRSGEVRLSNGGSLGGGCFELYLP